MSHYRKSFTPLVYNIKKGVIIPLVLNLTGIIKIKKTIFGWKKATKYSSVFHSKSVLKEKPWKCKQGISPAQLNKRSEEEKLCEIILHPEFNLHSNSIYRWMNDGNQLRASKLQSPSLLLCEKIPSQHWKILTKNSTLGPVLPLQQFFVYAISACERCIELHDHLQRKQYLIWRTCLHFKIPMLIQHKTTDLLLKMYLNKGKHFLSILYLDIRF